MPKHFFDEMSQYSDIKSQIVSDYFGAWTTVMTKKSRSQKLAYIDLFSGPGRYSDGSKSTPVKVIEQIIKDEVLRKKMVVIFNDANPEFSSSLRNEIINLPGIETLRNKPIVSNFLVGDDIADTLKKLNLIPSLSFIDPWGYKGLSSKLISALIKDWGSDCIFFFNYNRINMGLTNPRVIEHMDSIFGSERANDLRQKVGAMSPLEREEIILNELAETLSNDRENHVLPFKFIKPYGERTSHYLILVSKHILGYNIMKNIMYKYSSKQQDGVASFSYISVSNKQLSLLSLFNTPFDDLGNKLCEIFAGKTLTVSDIYEQHQLNTPFVLANYKEVLKKLEKEGRIICNPSKRQMRNGEKTMSENVKITFPK